MKVFFACRSKCLQKKNKQIETHNVMCYGFLAVTRKRAITAIIS